MKTNYSFLYIAAFGCLLAMGLLMFSKSAFFTVKTVQVDGTDRVTEDEVLKLAGTIQGENIFLTDSAVLKQKIQLHPRISQVAVEKKLPATIVLRIKERQPAALIHTPEGMVEIDGQGVILKFYSSWPKSDSPVLTGMEMPQNLGPGQRISSPQLDQILSLLGQASTDLTKLMGEIHLATDGRFYIYLTTAKEVRLSQEEDYAGKLKLLEELLRSSEYKSVESRVKYIDVTAGKPVLGL